MNRSVVFTLLVSATLLLASCTGRTYRNGSYSGESRATYYENYYGEIRIRIENDRIAIDDFRIVDRNLGEVFDASYERHFSGNRLYVEQCRNDWKGVQTYPALFVEKQDISKVEVVSGATWSYNLFGASLSEALKKAREK